MPISAKIFWSGKPLSGSYKVSLGLSMADQAHRMMALAGVAKASGRMPTIANKKPMLRIAAPPAGLARVDSGEAGPPLRLCAGGQRVLHDIAEQAGAARIAPTVMLGDPDHEQPKADQVEHQKQRFQAQSPSRSPFRPEPYHKLARCWRESSGGPTAKRPSGRRPRGCAPQQSG